MWQAPRQQLTGAELSELKENLKIEIKALLCSAKEGLTERELIKEYKDYQGCYLPFSTLGYNTLYDLMKDLKDVCTIQKVFGNWVFYPVHDQTTIRLATLISGQKDEKKAVRNKSRFYEGKKRNLLSTSNCGLKPLLNFIPRVTSNIQQNVVDILKRSKDGRMLRQQFEHEYKRCYNFLFDFNTLGFTTLRQALESLSHIVKVEPTGTDYCVSLVNEIEKSVLTTNKNDEKAKFVSNSTVMIPQSLEEETISNLKKIMVEEDGIFLSDLLDAYKDFTGKDIEFEKLGYSDFEHFVYDKMVSFVRIDVDNPYEPKLYNGSLNLHESKKISKSDTDSDDASNLKIEIKLLQLKELIDELLSKQTLEKIPLDQLFSKFEEYYGWKLDHCDYGFKDKDELTSEIIQRGFITIDMCNHLNKHIMILCPSKKTLIEIPQTRAEEISETFTSSNSPEKSYQLATAEFMKAYILENKELSDSDDVLIKLSTNKTHRIIVSNVVNPCNIQIQLAENNNDLNILMKDLEEVYCGLGASNFNMPDSYIEHGALCAAIYPQDNNWHRCRITGVYKETNKARVFFIDYGGESLVSLDDVKFLSRDFAYLPVQAVNAKFANIAQPANGKWPKDIINYLLNRVTQHKALYADVVGFNDGFVSLEIYYYVQSEAGKCKISLNNRLVQDGFGTKYVEKDDVEFYDFETWQKKMIEKSINKSKRGDVSSNADTFDRKLEKAYEVYKSNNSINQVHKLKSPATKESVKDGNRYYSKATNDFGQIENDSSLSVFDKEKSLMVPKHLKILNQSSTRDRFKVKEIIYLDPNTSVKYYLKLIDIDGQIFVHWTEVASIFGISDQVFKVHLKTLDSSYKYSDQLFVKFAFNEKNEDIFDFVSNTVNVDLHTIGEIDTVWMLKYKQLYALAESCLSSVRAESVKDFLRNNKFCKKSKGKENVSYYPSLEKSKIPVEKQLSPNIIQQQVDSLVPSCLHLKEKLMSIGEKDPVQCQRLIEEFENLVEKIEFCRRNLK